MKKVLIIVYNFPPQLTVAARRVAKFVKYLKDFGWQPIVVTVKNSPLEAADEDLYKEISSVAQIYKTLDLFAFSAIKKKHLKMERLSSKELMRNNIFSYLKYRIILKIFRTFLIDDSNRIGWFPLTLFKCMQIMKNEKIDLVFTNSLPYSTHLIGFILNALTRIPWIADLREGWIFDKSLSIYDSGINLVFNKWLCRRTIHKARNIILPTPRLADLFKQKFKNHSHKIRYLPTGYDEEDFKEIQGIKKDDKFTITYAGYFYSELQLKYFVAALALLLAKRPDIKGQIKVVLLSNLNVHSPRYRFIKRYNLESIIELHPILPRKEYIEYIMASDILLFIHVSTPWSRVRLGTKTFDYIRSGRFILALVPHDGGVASLIHETRTGISADLYDTAAIQNILSDLYDKYKKGSLNSVINRALINKYEVKNIVKNIALLFDEKVENKCK